MVRLLAGRLLESGLDLGLACGSGAGAWKRWLGPRSDCGAGIES